MADLVDIGGWLAAIGLEQYTQDFADNDIDGEVLPELTAEDLKDIGVTSVGHRRKLLSAIEKLSEPQPPEGEARPVAKSPKPDSSDQSSGAQTAAERRHLTVMFCDLMDSTAISVNSDPEDFRDFIARFRQVLGNAVAPFGGHVAQYLGDGVFVYFGYPKTDEHDAENAVAAGLAIVKAVKAMAMFDGYQPAVRIGIATGLTVVGGVGEGAVMLGNSAVGETPNLAARLQALAEANTIIVASTTRKPVGNLFDCTDLGTFDLKGFDRPMRAWRIEGHSRAESRFGALRGNGLETAFVGREGEMTRLRNRLAEARAGHGQFVVISGESGYGKSRLVHQIVAETAGKGSNIPMLQCTPYNTGAPFYPLRKFIRQAAGISHEDNGEVSFSKLETWMCESGFDDDQQIGLASEFLNIKPKREKAPRSGDPQTARARLLALLGEMVIACAQASPILILEDLQWIDPSTAEMIQAVSPKLQDTAVMLLGTMRPHKDKAWLGDLPVRMIEMERLSRYDVIRLVSAMAGDQDVPETVLDTIVERADGIPIFAEELARGYLEAAKAGEQGEAALQAIPKSMTDSLMARLDRLKNGRALALTAAVIGHEFPIDFLIEISDLVEETARAGIDELLDAYVMVIGHSPFGEAISFRHMLMRDAAYQVQLRRDRVRIHKRVAKALQSKFGHIGKLAPHVLAVHQESAGDVVSAAQSWALAGEQAYKRSAYVEAAGYLENAIAANAKAPDNSDRDRRELEFRLARLSPLIASTGYSTEEVTKETDRVAALCRLTGAQDKLLPALTAQWVAYNSLDLAGRFELGRQMMEAARKGSEIDQLLAHRVMATTCTFAGRFDDALEHNNRFFEIYDHDKHEAGLNVVGPSNHALTMMLGQAEIHTIKGDFERGESWRDKAFATAEQRGNVHSQCLMLVFAGCLMSAFREDFEALGRYASKLRHLAEENDLPWVNHAKIFLGLHQISTGEQEDGFLQARSGAKVLERENAFGVPWLAAYGDACVRAERFKIARRHTDMAKPVLDGGELWMAAELHRLHALIEHAQGGMPEAVRQHIDAGLAIARKQGAGLFVKRLTTLQSRLL